MLWRNRNSTTFPEGSGTPADLRSIVGFAGRLLFAPSLAGSQMIHVPCTVLTVGRNEVIIQVSGADGAPQAGGAVILEVALATALIQCFTTVRRHWPGGRIALGIPGRPHVLQRRRFPRIDLFTGVILKHSERPLEELPAQLINLSIDGAACVLGEPVTPGTKLLINMIPIGLHPPEARAAVVRCTPTPSHLWVIGIRFLELTPEQELYLGKYISQQIETV